MLKRTMLLGTGLFCGIAAVSAQTSPVVPPFDPPNPCPTPPTITAKNLGRFSGKWQEIKPSGCAFGLYPPKGVRVLLYFPAECVTPGKGCGYMVFGRYGYSTLNSGFSTEKSVHTDPSHWMVVSRPSFRR